MTPGAPPQPPSPRPTTTAAPLIALEVRLLRAGSADLPAKRIGSQGDPMSIVVPPGKRLHLTDGVNLFAKIMVRVIQYRNYGVYVNDERGGQHHLAHAHIKHRGIRIASVYLTTLTYYWVVEPVPPELEDLVAERQQELQDRWKDLNS